MTVLDEYYDKTRKRLLSGSGGSERNTQLSDKMKVHYFKTGLTKAAIMEIISR